MKNSKPGPTRGDGDARVKKPNRRSFLADSARIVAAPAILTHGLSARGASANDRIQIGVIGCGSRGFNLIDALIRHDDKAQIVAICDVDQRHYRDREWGKGPAMGLLPAKERIQSSLKKRKSGSGDDVSTCSDFRKITEREDIDAVVVATPDHWHALCTLSALQSGKDVYCEKPVTHFFAEGQTVYREVEKQKAIFQTGSQQRSDWRFRRAVELTHNGHLGDIRRLEVGLSPGYAKPQDDTQTVAVPEHLDYDFWCGPAPKLPYMRARHHRWWRGHRAFGGGVLMDWIGHHNDIAHWVLGVGESGPTCVEAIDWTFPESSVYNTPHHYTIRCEYRGGVESTISSRIENGLKVIGTDGWVYVNRGKLTASDARWTKEDFDPGEKKAYRSDDHVENFLDCMRSRQPCIAPAETAHRSITPGHLGYVSAALGRSIKWDPESETATADAEANLLLRNFSYREPWSLDSAKQ